MKTNIITASRKSFLFTILVIMERIPKINKISKAAKRITLMDQPTSDLVKLCGLSGFGTIPLISEITLSIAKIVKQIVVIKQQIFAIIRSLLL